MWSVSSLTRIEPIPPALEGEVSLVVVLVFSLTISDVEYHYILGCDVYLGSFLLKFKIRLFFIIIIWL